MAIRWTASAMLSIENRMKRIMGYQQLWILESALKDLSFVALAKKESQEEKIAAIKERVA